MLTLDGRAAQKSAVSRVVRRDNTYESVLCRECLCFMWSAATNCQLPGWGLWPLAYPTTHCLAHISQCNSNLPSQPWQLPLEHIVVCGRALYLQSNFVMWCGKVVTILAIGVIHKNPVRLSTQLISYRKWLRMQISIEFSLQMKLIKMKLHKLQHVDTRRKLYENITKSGLLCLVFSRPGQPNRWPCHWVSNCIELWCLLCLAKLFPLCAF